jgi:hypothetical protein
MADLLECLLQIKGLDGTIARLAALVTGTPEDRWTDDATALLRALGEAEVLYGAGIRLMLVQSGARLPAADREALAALGARVPSTPHVALARFTTRRRDNLELLDACTAADLSRTGVHPTRRSMTLADLIAVMLASDVEAVGEIRQALRPRP